ncbi:hypothetical protein FXO38_26147 [Capsicum annuum]|nr:hypothetical protein FXO38_26147 [Capsicum annuum]
MDEMASKMAHGLESHMKQSSIATSRRTNLVIMILLRTGEASCFCRIIKAREDDMDAFTLFIMIHDGGKSVIANFKQDQGWPIPSRRNLSDREFKDYMQLLPLLNKFFPQSSLPDCLFWKPHSKGHFPVKSCYNNLTVPNHEDEQMKILRAILTIFEGVSQLHVNWRKSLMFPVNEPQNFQLCADILGGEVGTLPMSYVIIANLVHLEDSNTKGSFGVRPVDAFPFKKSLPLKLLSLLWAGPLKVKVPDLFSLLEGPVARPARATLVETILCDLVGIKTPGSACFTVIRRGDLSRGYWRFQISINIENSKSISPIQDSNSLESDSRSF